MKDSREDAERPSGGCTPEQGSQQDLQHGELGYESFLPVCGLALSQCSAIGSQAQRREV